MRLLDSPIEIGPHDKPLEIAHDQERGIQQGFPVAKKLFVRFLEVLAGAFVFPAEAIALPNVRETSVMFYRLCAAGRVKIEQLGILGDPFLEAKVVIPRGIRLDRRGQAKHPAKVVEMLGVSRAFLPGKLCPLLFEFRRGHRAQSLHHAAREGKQHHATR